MKICFSRCDSFYSRYATVELLTSSAPDEKDYSRAALIAYDENLLKSSVRVFYFSRSKRGEQRRNLIKRFVCYCAVKWRRARESVEDENANSDETHSNWITIANWFLAESCGKFLVLFLCSSRVNPSESNAQHISIPVAEVGRDRISDHKKFLVICE